MSKEIVIGCGWMIVGFTMLVIVAYHQLGSNFWWAMIGFLGLLIFWAGLLYVRTHE